MLIISNRITHIKWAELACVRTFTFFSFLLSTLFTSFANEQQIVIHWTTETDLSSPILLKDRDGAHLDAASTSNGDGNLVTLGYFDLATSADPFTGTWIPLTFGTRLGDSSSGYGFADGTFGFTTVFTKNSNLVSVYPNEPASYNVNSQVTIVTNAPPVNHPICIRFYDRTITGPSARYNTVTGPQWRWPSFSSGVPTNMYLKISNATPPGGSTWNYGSTFEDSNSTFKCSLQVQANLSAYVSTGGTLSPDPTGAYPYDSGITLNAVPTTRIGNLSNGQVLE